MPKYLGVECIGACERIGYRCENQSLYKQLAKEFNAHVTRRRIHEEINGRVHTWYEWILDVPEENREAVIDLFDAAHMRKDPDFWLGEFPCHSFCDLTVCGWCGTIHEEDYIHEDYCELFQDVLEEDELYGYVDEDDYY